MKLALPAAKRTQATLKSAFTLAEVLAAMVFMAVVIPVAVQGLRVAGVCSVVSTRKVVAARIAEKVLNEQILGGSSRSIGSQTGEVVERGIPYSWSVQTEPWEGDSSSGAPQQVTVEVTFTAQDREFAVMLSTLTETQTQTQSQ